MKQDRFKRVEQKYLFPAGYTDLMRTWLEHACVPDPRYPTGAVSSIYFDTPELFHYRESRNGEFLRTKVRLRWYDGPSGDSLSADQTADTRCFLEVKAKRGALSEKKRIEVALPAGTLLDEPFSSDRVLDLPARAVELGFHLSGIMVPVLIVRYERRRYLDIASGSTLVLDTGIRCTEVNEAVLRGLTPVHLDVGVLEVKGLKRGTREVLDPIGAYLTKSSFSKYVITLEFLMQPLERRI
jgi:hypothetical protein